MSEIQDGTKLLAGFSYIRTFKKHEKIPLILGKYNSKIYY